MAEKKQIKNFHLFMNKKIINQLKRIANRKESSVSDLIRKIISDMHFYLLNREFADSPRLSKRKNKIKNKKEIRVYIFEEDYNFFSELAYVLNFPSIAEVLRVVIDTYIRGISFDGETEYKNKVLLFKIKYELKVRIIIKNKTIIRKNIYHSVLKQRIRLSISEQNVISDVILF